MDQGPIAQSGAWLAVGREIAQTLECVDPLAFRRFVASSEMRGLAGSSPARAVPGLWRRWPQCGSCTWAAMRIVLAKRPPRPFGPPTGSASYQAPAIPQSPSTSLE
jgi:hypothetical protein